MKKFIQLIRDEWIALSVMAAICLVAGASGGAGYAAVLSCSWGG